ncbi:hypothetical protein KKE45_04080, partial [Patescibacteria group bacterium]|nr:hypothetical protein [Patescibacteria group bacterium]
QKILNINKTCRYCPQCELIIAKQHEIDEIIMQFLGLRKLSKEAYMVVGTQDKKAYLAGVGKGLIKESPFAGVSVFKDVWEFDIKPAGWYPKEGV